MSPSPPGSSSFAFTPPTAGAKAKDGLGGASAPEVPPREEWLIAEWPEDHEQPTDYWISNLPANTEPERLARLARMRWKMELDYKQLKGELGLDHDEGRSWLGWYHHTANTTAAHGFLTLERLNPFHPRPACTLPKAVLLLQPLFKCWDGRCRTCQRTIKVNRLALTWTHNNE